MIRTVFIDFDDTLHDSDSKFAARLDGLFGLRGLDLWRTFLEKIHRDIVHVRYPDRHEDEEFHAKLLFDYLGKPFDPVAAEAFRKACDVAKRERWSNPAYFPDAFKFLAEAKGLGYVLCLTTGEHAREKAAGIEKFSGRQFFDHVFGEKDLGHNKGDVGYFMEALRVTRTTPRECVCIGDTLTHDIAPAKLAGITTIWLNRRQEVLPDGFPRPDFEAHSLTEALEFVKEMGE